MTGLPDIKYFMGRNIRKRPFWHMRPTKVQISLPFVGRMKKLAFLLSKMCPVKVLIRLCECAGWSESSLVAHIERYVFWRCDSNTKFRANQYVMLLMFAQDACLMTLELFYCRTSMAWTSMARLPWLNRTHFWVPTEFSRYLEKHI